MNSVDVPCIDKQSTKSQRVEQRSEATKQEDVHEESSLRHDVQMLYDDKGCRGVIKTKNDSQRSMNERGKSTFLRKRGVLLQSDIRSVVTNQSDKRDCGDRGRGERDHKIKLGRWNNQMSCDGGKGAQEISLGLLVGKKSL